MGPSMKVNWGTCKDDGAWCGLHTVDLSHPTFNKEGIYIIWEKAGRILRVGKGQLRDKIIQEKQNPAILVKNRPLVTWTAIESKDRSGVERYLVEHLTPVIPSKLTDAPPIEVNLPWPYQAL